MYFLYSSQLWLFLFTRGYTHFKPGLVRIYLGIFANSINHQVQVRATKKVPCNQPGSTGHIIPIGWNIPSYLGGGNSNIVYFHPETWGRFFPQFDLRIFFSDGLVKNHQLARYTLLYIYFQPFIGATHGQPSIFFTRLQGPHTEWSQVRWPRPPKTQPNQQVAEAVPIPSIGTAIYTYMLVDFYRKCRLIYQSHGWYEVGLWFYYNQTMPVCYYVFTIALLFSPSQRHFSPIKWLPFW